MLTFLGASGEAQADRQERRIRRMTVVFGPTRAGCGASTSVVMVVRVLCSLVSTMIALCACMPAAPVVTTVDAPRPDTDAPRLARLSMEGREGSIDLGRARAWLTLPDGRVLVVDEDRSLVLFDGTTRKALLDDVLGEPVAFRADGVLAARATGPGESDLWLVPLDGDTPRAIAAQRGADGQPFVLDDGRVLFVSDRAGVASVFVVDVTRDPQRAQQVTNVGERPGALSSSFLPPPVRWLSQRGARVRYHDGVDSRELHVDASIAGVR